MILILLQEERAYADEEARERDGLYERAEALAAALAAVGDALREAVDDVNAGTVVCACCHGSLLCSAWMRRARL